MTPFPLVILTPDREWFNGPAECVTAPGQAGEFGVLANHIPMVAGLKPGVLRVRVPGGGTGIRPRTPSSAPRPRRVHRTASGDSQTTHRRRLAAPWRRATSPTI